MKTRPPLVTSVAVVTAATMVLAGGLRSLGQDDQQKESKSGQQQTSEKDKQELKVSEQEMHQQVKDVNKASKFIGMTVKNKQDEDLGKIKDVVFDLQKGKIAYAVLSAGGTFGIGGKMVAVPIEALTVKEGEKALLIDLAKQQLTQAPGFNEQNWPDLNAAQKGETIGLAKSQESQGATGSQSQQTRGSGSITNLEQLSASADPSKLEGQPVRIQGAKVDKAIGQKVACLTSDSGQKVLVIFQRPIQNLRPGQTVQVQGTTRKMPSDPAQLGIDPQSAQEFKDQKVYIQATQVTPSSQ